MLNTPNHNSHCGRKKVCKRGRKLDFGEGISVFWAIYRIVASITANA
jgi:hypothetical protein